MHKNIDFCILIIQNIVVAKYNIVLSKYKTRRYFNAEKELLENDGTMSDSYSGDGNCISAGKNTGR